MVLQLITNQPAVRPWGFESLMLRQYFLVLLFIWGCSSVGRAPALQVGGRGFESNPCNQKFGGISKEKPIKIPKSILDLSKRTITKILQRANQGCMICGWKEATCDIHHIKPKKEGGTNDNSNLIVLCPNCHRKVHDHLLIIPENINIETLFKNWTNYYFVDLNELEKLIDVNKFDIGDIS